MVKPLLLKSSIKRSSRLMASHASKFLSDRVQAPGVDKNVWEWAEILNDLETEIFKIQLKGLSKIDFCGNIKF